MKKIFALCLVFVMLVGMTFAASAAPSGFVSSPSGQDGPKVEDFKPGDEECTAELVITPYGEREELNDTLLQLFEKAYDEVVKSGDLTKLNDEFAKVVSDLGIDPKKLAVSDLFDIHVTGCDFHDGHVDFDIVLSADLLEHFVGLLHMNKNGVWELVSDAKVTGNSEHLKFSVESFSPFAIIIDTTDVGVEGPETGDTSNAPLYAVIMFVSAIALGVVIVIGKKQKA